MSRIRSAWEIALEKTEDIVIDKAKLAFDEEVKKIRALAGTYLNGDGTDEETVGKLSALIKNEALREGIKTTILQNLTLPQEKVLTDRFERLQSLVTLITQDPQTMELMGQIIGFLKQYPEHREQLIGQLKEQFMPMLEQKAQQAGQYGNVPMNPENDPEFLKIAQQQLDKLTKQYTDTLEGAKEQLKTLL